MAEADMSIYEQCFRANSHKYFITAKQLATKLEQERQVSLSGDRFGVPAKKGFKVERTRHSHQAKT